MDDYLCMKSITEYILEMDANTLPSDIKINDDKDKGILTISFGKNGWGLTNEFAKINEVVHQISQHYNIYLDDVKIDPLDDVYDFVFRYDNKHFDD